MVAVLAGCVSAPEPEIDRAMPGEWLGRDGANTGGARPLSVTGLQTWWRRWNDPELSALVDSALAQNLDFAQALGRLKQQRLLMGTASASYRPEVTSGARTLQDIAAADSYFHASIDVTWGLGLFGLQEATVRSAQAEVLDAQAKARGVSVTLVADVVRRYLDIRLAKNLRSLSNERVALEEHALHLARVRLKQRLDGSGVVHQVQMQLQQSRDQLSELRESQTRAAHALAALLGRERPDPRWLAEDADASFPQADTFELQVLPADLLRSRPDIETAEAAVGRAAGALGISRSALYPRFALSGSLLYSYNLTQNRRTTSDQMPVLGPVIDIPLFDWGRRRSQAEADEVALDNALMGYRQSVLEGLADVEGALAGVRAQRERMASLERTQQLVASRVQVLRRRQQLGLASDYSRLGEERALLQNRVDQAVTQGVQALAYVTLYKALGGAPLPAALKAKAPPLQSKSED